MPLRAPKGFISESDPRVSLIGHPAPAWLVNYADLMTELVCFFVILYALSAALNKKMQAAAQDVRAMMESGEMKGDVKIDREGLKITIQEQGDASFFGTGEAEPTPEIDAKLAKLVPNLRTLSREHDILVEGHTDSQGIHNDYFDSNWELSTARATSVTRLLIEKYGLAAERLGAVGYGAARPIADNATAEGRARNRRVVIFVKSGAVKGAAAARPPAPAGGTAPAAPAGLEPAAAAPAGEAG